MENLTELTAKIGFNIETRKLDGLKNSLLSIKNILYVTFGTVAIKSLFNQFSSIIDTLDRVRAGLFLGRQANPVWYLLGIDPTQDPNKVFDELLKKLKQIKDVGIRRSRAAELGFNPDLIESLINTNTRGIVIKDIVNDLRNIKQSILEIIIRITTGLAPVVKTISTFLTNWRIILDNIFLSMGGWQEGITKILRVFILIYVWNNKLKSLIIGLGLVLEDLWIFSKGGKSYFEEVLKYFNLTQEQIEKIRTASGGIFQGLKDGFATTLEVFTNSIKIFIEAIKNFFLTLLQDIQLIFSTVNKGIKVLLIPFTKISSVINTITQKTNTVLKDFIDMIKIYIELLNKTIHPFKTIKDMFTNKEEKEETEKDVLNNFKKDFNTTNNYFNTTNNKNYTMETIKQIEKTAIPNTNNKYINQNDNRNITNNFNINETQSPKQTAKEIMNLQEQLNYTQWEI